MSSTESFAWPETEARLRGLLAEVDLADAAGGGFVGTTETSSLEFTPPLVLGRPSDGTAAAAYLATAPTTLGVQCLILVRAGASALGVWREDELVAHKVFKRYVVRGRGRAQPTHLASKGKSRYGSRLRLRNARRHLEETNERVCAWHAEFGPFDRVLFSAPTRLWADLLRAEPALPFEPECAEHIPMHVHTPSHDELLRVRRSVRRGRIVSQNRK